ncbi:hypothetical protein [Thalassobaculum litoreum]|uniref:Uncharacterized protein n=1 Tax=Thalassobaculum litoreum DSM 18839 TaxID=1123362 RepID=A0A8G2BDV8_9PROT|nr:hypothetical protein [Thalassobaculum litoreum]SDF08417.1 hypothetical protein SAMN05660686_00182 [Thalassobaculum litoreum DSM 18839]
MLRILRLLWIGFIASGIFLADCRNNAVLAQGDPPSPASLSMETAVAPEPAAALPANTSAPALIVNQSRESWKIRFERIVSKKPPTDNVDQKIEVFKGDVNAIFRWIRRERDTYFTLRKNQEITLREIKDLSEKRESDLDKSLNRIELLKSRIGDLQGRKDLDRRQRLISDGRKSESQRSRVEQDIIRIEKLLSAYNLSPEETKENNLKLQELRDELEYINYDIQDIKAEIEYVEVSLKDRADEKERLEKEQKIIFAEINDIRDDFNLLNQYHLTLSDNSIVTDDYLEQIDDHAALILLPESEKNEFKMIMSATFAGLVLSVIVGFFVVSYKDEYVRKSIFSNQSGIQFITLFSLVIAIILFGILGVLGDKELAALLGGLSGYILGKVGDGIGRSRPPAQAVDQQPKGPDPVVPG